MTANYMLPRSAARSAIRHEQKRQVRAAMRGMRSDTAPGEKIMGALMPGRGYAFPGGWSQDRIAQIQHMKDWTGVCIDKIASLCAQLVPNVAYVSQGRPKSASKGYSPYRQQLDGLTSGIRRLQHYDCAGFNFQTHPYRAKALGVVKPNEELEPVEWNHPLRKLIENPNAWDTQYDHDYELIMFQYLCGVAYDWAVPVDYHWEDHKDFSTPVADGPFKGYPGELWCLPSHWVWPRSSGGSLVSPGHPDADKLIEYYEVRPWGGLGTAGVIRIPPDQIIRYAFKSPINKIDGWARTQMGAAWIDTDDSIATCQRSMMTNGIYPSFWLEMGEGFSDLTDDQVDRVEAKIYQKLGGENRFGRPFISSQGTKPHPLVFPPNQYAFSDSGDQSRNRIVALFGLNLSILGMSESRTFGSVLADLMGVIVNSIKPVLTANGQTKTKFLVRYFSTPQRPLKCWYDDPTPIDPDQLNKDISEDRAGGALTPNEQRALRGRPPYEHGGDDPLVPGPGGLIPLPLQTGMDLSGLAELVPLLGRQENPAAEEEEAESGLGSPQVEEPNGKPGKPKKSYDDRQRLHDDYTGQFAPMSGVPEEEENLSTTLANGKTVEFTAKDSDGDATIMVDTAFLDGAWEGDEDYIEPGEDPDGKAEAFRRFLAKGKPVKAARATMDNGVVSFTDGGYRFAVLRDEGAEQMAVTVPKDQVDLFKPRAQQKRLSGRFQLKDGRWITINSEDGDGTHVFIDGSGTVTAGPPKLEGRKLDGPKSSLPNADKPSRKASTVKLEKGNEDKITRIWKEMLGDVPIDNVASLMGVPDGAELELDVWEESEGKLIDVKIYGEGYDANRFIRTNDNGEVFIYNAEFKVKDTGKGLGAQIFAKQVESASKIGVKYIECFAEGKANSRFNGYYTWPRFGYDATIADSFNHETQQKIEEAFPEAKTVQDIFKTKEGREWWKKNGSGTEMKFDLTKGSRSRKVLKAYQEEVKTRSKKSTSPPSKKLHSTGPGKASKSSYGPRSALPKFSKNGVH